MKTKLLLVMLLFAATLISCAQQPAEVTYVTYESTPQTVVVYKEPDAGRVVFTVRDAPVRMTDINELWITVDKVEIQTTQGNWVTVSSQENRYDMLQLREEGIQAIIADVELSPGTYSQVRLTISDVEVIDATGSHDAVLPSGVLRFNAPFSVSSDALTVVQFDFDLAVSLHLTGNGRYVLAPVIRVMTYDNANIRVLPSRIVVVNSGTPREVIVVGTNTQGEVGPGMQIPVNVNVQVTPGTNTIVIVNATTNTTGANVTVNTTTVTNVTVNATVNTSVNTTNVTA